MATVNADHFAQTILYPSFEQTAGMVMNAVPADRLGR